MSERTMKSSPVQEAVTEARNGSVLRHLFVAMRPHQWVKNLFIFAPLLFGMKLTDLTAIGNAVLAFSVFCFLASALYIFNDWIDLEDDRKHPVKCKRPLPSGLISARFALSGAGVFALTGFSIALFIGSNFALLALLYLVLTLSYCLALKRIVVLDAMTIAAGFVIRIVSGAVAVGVSASHWLIVCAYLLALFLGFTKRRQELLTLSDGAGDHRKVLDEYSVSFLSHANNILIGASIVCYALYAVAPETVERFGTDSLIYGTSFVIYGMFRYMILVENSENGGDPSTMLLKDRPLLLSVVGWGIYNAAVIYHSQWSGFLLS